MLNYLSDVALSGKSGKHFSKVESLPAADITALQEEKLRRQIDYLAHNSVFYQNLFAKHDIRPESIQTIADLARIPFVNKQDLRDSLQAAPPFGLHQAANRNDIIQMQASSGTTGSPSYVGLTQRDAYVWHESTARSLYACGMRPHDVVLHAFSMSKGFVGGLPIFQGIQYLGALDLPVGADGGVDRLLTVGFDLSPSVVVGTPNFLIYLGEQAEAIKGRPARDMGVKFVTVGGEPGGGIPAIRDRLQDLWDAKVCEVLGGTDLGAVYWAECEHQNGMHMTAPDFIITELIDPDTGETLPFETGVTGELVYSAIDRQASPVIRFRSGDHITVTGTSCPCGRTSPTIRCVGRTDDMLIIRGINVFPSAVQDIIASMQPHTNGVVRIVADFKGHTSQENLKLVVERGPDSTPAHDQALKENIETRIRNTLSVKAQVSLCPPGTFEMPGAQKVQLVLRSMPNLE